MMKERFSINVKVYQKGIGAVISAWYSASIIVIFSVMQSRDTVVRIVNLASWRRILKHCWNEKKLHKFVIKNDKSWSWMEMHPLMSYLCIIFFCGMDKKLSYMPYLIWHAWKRGS